MEYIDIVPDLLKKIQEDFKNLFESDRAILEVYEKLKKGTATYKEANKFALRVGDILADVFGEDISSGILPDGKMYYNIAERIVGTMMKNNYELIIDVTEQVQTALNGQAGIGIKAIQPDFNQDRASGIIEKVSAADVYDDVAWVLNEPIINFSQSIVDDSIKANADFHYMAGMAPRIIRTSTGKCCDWCNRVVGVHDYEKVKKTGNDVFRRHRYCRCTVEYVPGDGKKQDVWSKNWRKETPKANLVQGIIDADDRKGVRNIKEGTTEFKNVMMEYLQKATPGEGRIEYDSEYVVSRHKSEIKIAQWLHENLGGDIVLLQETGELHVKRPDYIWNGKFWELKNTSTAKAADSAVRSGLKQIAKNPGGLILDLEENDVSINELMEIVNARIKRTKQEEVDVLIIHHEELIKAIRYKK